MKLKELDVSKEETAVLYSLVFDEINRYIDPHPITGLGSEPVRAVMQPYINHLNNIMDKLWDINDEWLSEEVRHEI